jgi:hypothetical protein
MNEPLVLTKWQQRYWRGRFLLKGFVEQIKKGLGIRNDEVTSWLEDMSEQELDQFLTLTRSIDQVQLPSADTDPLPVSVPAIFDHPGFSRFVDKHLTRQRS